MPLVGLTMTGKPSSAACRAASASLAAGAPAHGTTGMPRLSARRLLAILSPSARIAAGEGPMNVTPSHSHSSANAGCSATKPQPGQAASARVCAQRPLEPPEVQVGDLAPAVRPLDHRRAEVAGLVRLAHEERAALGLGVEGDRVEALALAVELERGVDEAEGRLTAVDDRDPAEAALHGRAPSASSVRCPGSATVR